MLYKIGTPKEVKQRDPLKRGMCTNDFRESRLLKVNFVFASAFTSSSMIQLSSIQPHKYYQTVNYTPIEASTPKPCSLIDVFSRILLELLILLFLKVCLAITTINCTAPFNSANALSKPTNTSNWTYVPITSHIPFLINMTVANNLTVTFTTTTTNYLQYSSTLVPIPSPTSFATATLSINATVTQTLTSTLPPTLTSTTTPPPGFQLTQGRKKCCQGKELDYNTP